MTNFRSTRMSINAIIVGNNLLNEFRKHLGEEAYDKIMSEPIKGCKCGFIKEGDETLCSKCEKGASR